MALHLDYRPTTLEEVVGNDSVKDSLRSLFKRKEDTPHSFMFLGPSGTGKTTFARIIAKQLGCADSDFFEYNAANVRGIDTIREIDMNCRYAPLEGKIKVYLLDECAKLTGDAQNAVLKLLEDTPKHVYFILCTTDPDKIIKTIHTRCTTYQTKPLTPLQMDLLLKWVLRSEELEETYPKEIIKEIIKASDGCPRQALVLLDSVIDITDEKKALEAISSYSLGTFPTIELCRAIMGRASTAKWNSIKEIVSGTTEEPERIRYAILGYLTKVLYNSKEPDRIIELMEPFMESMMYSGKAGLAYACYLVSKM